MVKKMEDKVEICSQAPKSINDKDMGKVQRADGDGREGSGQS